MTDNPWAARDKQIADLQAQVRHLQALPHKTEAARLLADNILTILAQKPVSQWPTEAQLAFKLTATITPLLKEMYKP